MAFGSIDYCADLGCAHTQTALLAASCEIVLASRLAGIAPPLDGVTLALDDGALARHDACHAVELGFGGKLCVHPSQVAFVREGFAPSADDIAWARRIVSTDGRVGKIAGEMVDPPVRLRAEQMLKRAAALGDAVARAVRRPTTAMGGCAVASRECRPRERGRPGPRVGRVDTSHTCPQPSSSTTRALGQRATRSACSASRVARATFSRV
ncbi:HpcH/HpaI aldolase/citrate lyase family protein [Phenylobacterium sp.]|uniref:HpcH/HpaI aldolase/citrate lyase family protein n=1 Tax=Phenylobacterium sp. TaxID=1871053 RepID=UPI003BAD9194